MRKQKRVNTCQGGEVLSFPPLPDRKISMNPNDIYNHDIMAPGSGAFKGLIRQVKALHGKEIPLHRGGSSFAVGGQFRYLSVATALAMAYRLISWKNPSAGDLWKKASEIELSEKLKLGLYYPTQESAKIAGLSPSAGIGGLIHELGHLVCDEGGKTADFESAEPIFLPLLQKLDRKGSLSAVRSLPKWSNLTVDIRLERMMGDLYPHSTLRFEAVQAWVHGLETETRKRGGASTQ